MKQWKEIFMSFANLEAKCNTVFCETSAPGTFKIKQNATFCYYFASISKKTLNFSFNFL